MCGRYALTSNADVLVELFGLGVVPEDLRPRYNVAPTQLAPVVRERDGERHLDLMKWGLVPSWAKDPAIGNRMINARSETAAEKPSFRNALKKRRALVPADAFYEWKKLEGRTKQPYCIRAIDRAPLALAGLWEYWRPKPKDDGANGADDDAILSFTILTTTPNETVRPLHDRMPVIIAPADFGAWLDPARDASDLLHPAPDDLLETYAVSTHVNSPAHDDAACLEPVELF